MEIINMVVMVAILGVAAFLLGLVTGMAIGHGDKEGEDDA